MMPDKTFDHSAEQTDRQFLSSPPRAADSLSAVVQPQDIQRELADLRRAVAELQQQTDEVAALRPALEDERRRYHEVFELSPDAYLLTDFDGVIIEANRAAAALLSVQRDFLVKKSLLLFMSEVERAALETHVAAWRNPDRLRHDRRLPIIRGQLQLRVYKGASFPADFTISPARDGAGQIIGLRWILRDQSESIRTEQTLREREYHYRTLFDHAGDAIFIHNLTGRYLDVNQVACESLGYTREELLGMTPADVTAPELHECLPQRMSQLQQEGHLFCETVHVRRDGSRFPVELNCRLIEYAGGPAVLSIGRDITERKQAEQALLRRSAQLELLSDIGRKITAILELVQVLDRAAHLVQESFGYHHVALFLVDDDRSTLVMKASAGDFVKLFPPGHRVQHGRGMVGWVAEHGTRLWANDVNDEPHYINYYPDLIPTCSELSVPIQIGDQTVGVLDVQSPHFNDFDEDDVKVMETLADQIAVAIANARLYEAAQTAHSGQPGTAP
jgi:PAS domain S-box-containing protein